MIKNLFHKYRPPEDEEEREPPSDHEAEKAVLGSFLQNPQALLADAQATIPTEAFHHAVNRQLYQELLSFPDWDGLDMVTFTSFLGDKGILGGLGGVGEIASVLNCASTSGLYDYYKKIILSKLKLRKIIENAKALEEECHSYHENPSSLEDSIRSKTAAIEGLFKTEEPEKKWKDRISDIKERWSQCYEGRVPSSMPSPWKSYNREMGGVQKGYIVTMGLRKRGKSTLAKQIALHGALALDAPTAIFNNEMGEEATIYRCVCEIEGIDSDYLFRPDIKKPSEVMKKRIVSCMDRIASSRLRIYQANGMTADQICDEIRKHKFEFSVVDILQKVRKSPSIEKNATYEREVADNSLRFSGVASEGNGCTVMALSHMNKEGDARHSSAILNDCDLGLEIQDQSILVRYHRNGRSDFEIPIALDGATFRFKDVPCPFNPEPENEHSLIPF